MKRLLALGAAATAVTLGLGVVPAQAASPVLSPKEVKATYGKTVKGKSVAVRGVMVPVNCKKNRVLRLAEGREANYTATGDSYFAVLSGNYRAVSTGSAKSLVNKIALQVRCLGTMSSPGATVRVSKVKMPRLGNQRVAYRATTTVARNGVTVSTNATVYVVRKKTRVAAYGVFTVGPATPGKDVKMVKKAAKRL